MILCHDNVAEGVNIDLYRTVNSLHFPYDFGYHERGLEDFYPEPVQESPSPFWVPLLVLILLGTLAGDLIPINFLFYGLFGVNTAEIHFLKLQHGFRQWSCDPLTCLHRLVQWCVITTPHGRGMYDEKSLDRTVYGKVKRRRTGSHLYLI